MCAAVWRTQPELLNLPKQWQPFFDAVFQLTSKERNVLSAVFFATPCHNPWHRIQQRLNAGYADISLHLSKGMLTVRGYLEPLPLTRHELWDWPSALFVDELACFDCTVDLLPSLHQRFLALRYGWWGGRPHTLLSCCKLLGRASVQSLAQLECKLAQHIANSLTPMHIEQTLAEAIDPTDVDAHIEAELTQEIARKMIAHSLQCLPQPQRQILCHKLGLLGHAPLCDSELRMLFGPGPHLSPTNSKRALHQLSAYIQRRFGPEYRANF